MPGFRAAVFVDPERRDGVVALCNATTGMDYEVLPCAVPRRMELGGGSAWVPTERVPDEVLPTLGVWFWGNTALELRWQNERLELRMLNGRDVTDAFELRDGRLVGVSGYHRGETLHVSRHHLECATFVFTRTPYDPDAPIPGGLPG